MAKKLSSVRVISGKFKSRKIIFPDNLMIRPSGDRIRESLFSWLQTEIAGANCLDLFAGSGALGIEALSRAAKRVNFVEINKKAALALNQNLQSFGIRNATVHEIDAFDWLRENRFEDRFSIVFLDPPFTQDLLPSCYSLLEKANILTSECKIYIESRKEIEKRDLPSTWNLIKNKKAGSVHYCLCQRISH